MSEPIISVKNLSKKYVLGERQPYYSFRDTISGIFKAPFKQSKLKKDEFWALKDISFDVNQGDVIGIIGRNGAGKSTLLKILSQITPPTTGEIKMHGRVASLLEVGTGFHQELTGRENIYLNGAILGMKRWEINNKFKEIVEFAEIEKFLDTPVKHYSSGLYMRLAFAIAAHLEPEILIVDEVLAVGDAQFQKKCLGKMDDVAKKDGRTVLFVSHNMGAIESLCSRTLLMIDGEVKGYDDSRKIISEYLFNNTKKTNTYSCIDSKKPGTKFLEIEITSKNKDGVIGFREPILITSVLKNETNSGDLVLGYSIQNESGQVVTSFHSQEIGFPLEKDRIIKTGLNKISIILSNQLRPGLYSLSCSIFSRKLSSNYDYKPEILSFEIKNNGSNDIFYESQQGIFFNKDIDWKINAF